MATTLWSEGTVTFKPGGPGCGQDEGLWMKWPWWQQGQRRQRLVIEGRRLDGAAKPLRSHVRGAYMGGFQSSALIFPTPGCWEVTGRVGDQSLTFVTRVAQIADGPVRCRHVPSR
jgi:hypothetical protein